MFTYVCLGTNDLAAAIEFYDAVLAPLALRRCITPEDEDWTGWAGWGAYDGNSANELALWICKPFDGRSATAGNGTMIALRASSREAVRGFHDVAVRLGGRSEGGPGLRPQHGADFYAAYIRDLDGNKLAAVCRGTESRRSGTQ